MNDMSNVIEPKSDQINADSFIDGPRTFKIEGVSIKPGTEQPVEIALSDSKPWRPCKSMSRVLVAAWGADAKQYAGRSVTLYRDPSVKWGGLEVGGIRVSHLSDIANPMTMALTATKGSRKPYTVKPLTVEKGPDITILIEHLNAAETMDGLVKTWADMAPDYKRATPEQQRKLTTTKDQRKADLSDAVNNSGEE